MFRFEFLVKLFSNELNDVPLTIVAADFKSAFRLAVRGINGMDEDLDVYPEIHLLSMVWVGEKH